jgi:hypothetical protein
MQAPCNDWIAKKNSPYPIADADTRLTGIPQEPLTLRRPDALQDYGASVSMGIFMQIRQASFEP